ncbi:MAG: hypothetical protein SVM79_10340 [Chloroflexota bacterium]|nr:hypothetical protein [Chloroflexota bacterium]
MSENNRWANTVIGLAAIGSACIGVVGFIAALFPFFNGNYSAAGLLLIASALSFGLLSIAVFHR